jgi:hypothetical protein
MGQFYCEECEQFGDSHDGDSQADPEDCTKMIHDECLTDRERSNGTKETHNQSNRDKAPST